MQNYFVISFLVCLVTLSAKEQDIPHLPSVVTAVTEKIVAQEYSQAERIIARTPLDTPDSLFLEIILQQAQMADYESYEVRGRAFLVLCETAKKVFWEIPEYDRPFHHVYYLAVTEGAAAIVRGKRNDFIGAITASNSADKYLTLVLKQEPEFQPALFAVALKQFYTASLFTKIGLGKRTLQESLQGLEYAYQKGGLTADAVASSLFWVYMDVGNHEKARALAQSFLERYPENTLLRRGMVKYYREEKQWDALASSAQWLMEISSERKPQNWSDYYSGAVGLVESLQGRGDIPGALREIDRVLAISLEKDILKYEWVKKHRSHLIELKEELSEKMYE